MAGKQAAITHREVKLLEKVMRKAGHSDWADSVRRLRVSAAGSSREASMSILEAKFLRDELRWRIAALEAAGLPAYRDTSAYRPALHIEFELSQDTEVEVCAICGETPIPGMWHVVGRGSLECGAMLRPATEAELAAARAGALYVAPATPTEPDPSDGSSDDSSAVQRPDAARP